MDSTDLWFKSVLNAMSDLVLVKGPDSHLQWANTAFLDYYGMTEAELAGIVDGPHSDPDDTLQYVRDDQIVFRTGGHLDVKSEYITDSAGQIRSFHTMKSPVVSGGEVIASVGVSRPFVDDLSNSRVAPDHGSAKPLISQFRQIVGAAPVPMLLLDTRSKVAAYSSPWAQWFGAVVPGSNTSIGDFDVSLAGVEDLANRAASTDEPHVIEAEIGARSFEFAATPWHYDIEVQGGVLIVATEFTERVRREQELRDLNADLENFVRLAAHDLREPSRRQLMLTDLIVEDYCAEVSPQLMELLTQVQGQARRTLDLVSAFRLLTNIQGPEVEDEAIDLIDLLRDLIAELLPDLEETAFSLDVPDLVIGHPKLVEMIFRNLIDNAGRYGSAEMQLSVSATGQGHGQVFSVANSFSGVTSDTIDLVQPFVRGETSGDGMGIGLNICKRIAELHGGRLWLDNTASQFCVKFTLGEGADGLTERKRTASNGGRR